MAIIQEFIKGKTISLITQKEENIPKYVQWVNDPEVRRYARSMFPLTESDYKERFKSSSLGQPTSVHLDIWHIQDKLIIGTAGLHHISWPHRSGYLGCEIGERSYWNKGIASEAMALMITYGFEELNFHKILAQIDDKNIGSQKVAEKNGLIHEATLSKHEYVDGEYEDVRIYSIFRPKI